MFVHENNDTGVYTVAYYLQGDSYFFKKIFPSIHIARSENGEKREKNKKKDSDFVN